MDTMTKSVIDKSKPKPVNTELIAKKEAEK
jgi:hypothetical protein